jgi:hypothetical protein
MRRPVAFFSDVLDEILAMERVEHRLKLMAESKVRRWVLWVRILL